ncbi:J domain-containing protein [bacterium]|nr:J domain-containing protein [bacterium]
MTLLIKEYSVMDHYQTLGVQRGASDADIKQAYRKLARELHPDKGGDTIKFQKVQEAYETLSDPSKRREYDSPPQQTFVNFSFSAPQHNQTIQRKNDFNYNLKITLRDVYFGTNRKIRVQRIKMCGRCNVKCGSCGGAGSTTQHLNMGIFTQVLQSICPVCSGSGKHRSGTCDCKDGSITENNVFEIYIDKGTTTGKKIVFKEWGEQAKKFNESPGDLVVTIHVDESELFKRRGLDLFFKEKLQLKEIFIGKLINVPHFEGPVLLEVSGFGIINPHKEYIVFGKGLQDEGGKKGNLHINFEIEYPDKVLNQSEISKISEIFNQVGL